MQEKDRDCGDNAQRDEDEQRDPHANREAVGKRGLTGWDSHEPREPVVEFHSISFLRNLVALGGMPPLNGGSVKVSGKCPAICRIIGNSGEMGSSVNQL